MQTPHIPTDLDMALWDRGATLGWPYVGPLTSDQAKALDAYIAYCDEEEREYEAQMRAGGRTVCPQCGRRRVVHRTVCTYGRPGVEGSDYSDYAKCENCDYKDLA